jgi:TorA maturation chaperone TorD
MMISATATARNTEPRRPSAEEEGHAVRSALYAVLSSLFAARPEPALLQQIADADVFAGADTASPLAQAWRELCGSARVDAASAGEEFDALFVSPGQPAVSLYASSYMSGNRRGQLLAELRDDLARAGYARADDNCEYEDHFSALCDVMRGLIAEEAAGGDTFARQQTFFRSYLAPWHSRLFEAVSRTGEPRFYRRVAAFADAFLTHESEYFELA